jgi:hypothetical protein
LRKSFTVTCKTFSRSDNDLLAVIALAKLSRHVLMNASGSSGIFGDELYYLACADHPATCYVDHLPLSKLCLAVYRTLFRDSLFASRALPAIAEAVTVFMTGLIAREMGGTPMGKCTLCHLWMLLRVVGTERLHRRYHDHHPGEYR